MAQVSVHAHPRVSRKVSRVFIWAGVGLVLLLLVAFLGIGAVAASQLTLPARVFDPAINPAVYGLAYEELRFPARGDGLEVAAWYVPSDTNERAIILVHGRDNSRSNGFGNKFPAFAAKLHEAGFSVMMIDLRGHGESAGARFSFGIKERQDILGAVDWLEKKGYAPGQIGVLGYSLGAASVIGAAAEEKAIGAIWVDSSFADIQSVIERNWQNESGLPQVFLYSTQWMIRLLYGYNITASRPVDEIGSIAPRPVFIAHCQQDNLIPVTHMDQLVAEAQNPQTWLITNCDQHSIGEALVPENLNGHSLGYNIQPAVYAEKVIRFFDAALK